MNPSEPMPEPDERAWAEQPPRRECRVCHGKGEMWHRDYWGEWWEQVCTFCNGTGYDPYEN